MGGNFCRLSKGFGASLEIPRAVIGGFGAPFRKPVQEMLLSCATALHVDASDSAAERRLVSKVATRDAANRMELRNDTGICAVQCVP